MYLGLVLRGQTPCCMCSGRSRLQKAKALHFFILCEIRSHPKHFPKPGKDIEVRTDEI